LGQFFKEKQVTWPWPCPGSSLSFQASTWYILPVPAYKIWRHSLQLFRRYDCGRWNWQRVTWP